VSSGVYP